MFGACATAILSGREKSVMASGRSVRVIMAVLSGRVGPVVAMLVAMLVAMIVPLHHRMIVMMFLHPLIVMIFRVVLCTQSQRDHGSQRARCNGKNNRFPSLMTHGMGPFIVRKARNYGRRRGPHKSAASVIPCQR